MPAVQFQGIYHLKGSPIFVQAHRAQIEAEHPFAIKLEATPEDSSSQERERVYLTGPDMDAFLRENYNTAVPQELHAMSLEELETPRGQALLKSTLDGLAQRIPQLPDDTFAFNENVLSYFRRQRELGQDINGQPIVSITEN